MLTCSVIDALVAAGVTVDQLAAAVKAHLNEQERLEACRQAEEAERDAMRKAATRDRQRRWRAANGKGKKPPKTEDEGENLSRSVTVTSRDNDFVTVTQRDVTSVTVTNPSPPSPPLLSPEGFPPITPFPNPHSSPPLTPPSESPREELTVSGCDLFEMRAPRPKATRLPSDWEPSAEGYSFALKEGLTVPQADNEVAKFKDYWIAKSGKDATKLDWDRTWNNWVRRASENKSSYRTNGYAHRQTAGDRAKELAAEIRQREIAAGIQRPVAAI